MKEVLIGYNKHKNNNSLRISIFLSLSIVGIGLYFPYFRGIVRNYIYQFEIIELLLDKNIFLVIHACIGIVITVIAKVCLIRIKYFNLVNRDSTFYNEFNLLKKKYDSKDIMSEAEEGRYLELKDIYNNYELISFLGSILIVFSIVCVVYTKSLSGLFIVFLTYLILWISSSSNIGKWSANIITNGLVRWKKEKKRDMVKKGVSKSMWGIFKIVMVIVVVCILVYLDYNNFLSNNLPTLNREKLADGVITVVTLAITFMIVKYQISVEKINSSKENMKELLIRNSLFSTFSISGWKKKVYLYNEDQITETETELNVVGFRGDIRDITEFLGLIKIVLLNFPNNLDSGVIVQAENLVDKFSNVFSIIPCKEWPKEKGCFKEIEYKGRVYLFMNEADIQKIRAEDTSSDGMIVESSNSIQPLDILHAHLNYNIEWKEKEKVNFYEYQKRIGEDGKKNLVFPKFDDEGTFFKGMDIILIFDEEIKEICHSLLKALD